MEYFEEEIQSLEKRYVELEKNYIKLDRKLNIVLSDETIDIDVKLDLIDEIYKILKDQTYTLIQIFAIEEESKQDEIEQEW